MYCMWVAFVSYVYRMCIVCISHVYRMSNACVSHVYRMCIAEGSMYCCQTLVGGHYALLHPIDTSSSLPLSSSSSNATEKAAAEGRDGMRKRSVENAMCRSMCAVKEQM